MAQKWVKHVTSEAQYHEELRMAGPKLVVVKWTAAWCGPCKAIAPFVADLSEKHRNVVFLHVDVDENKGLAQGAGVRSMPTFHFIKRKQKIDEFSGADASKLEAKVKQHETAPDTSGIAYPSGMSDLGEFVDKSQMQCLNQSDDHKMANAFASGKEYLESDVDEQLLITLAFNRAVKVHSLIVAAPEHASQAPKTIKLFANKPHMGFDDATSLAPTQVLELTPEQVGEKAPLVPLKFVKFQNVNTLTIFIEDNQGDEETTVVQSLKVVGAPRDTMNVNAIKSMAPGKGE